MKVWIELPQQSAFVDRRFVTSMCIIVSDPGGATTSTWLGSKLASCILSSRTAEKRESAIRRGSDLLGENMKLVKLTQLHTIHTATTPYLAAAFRSAP